MVIQEVRLTKRETIWTYFDYLDTLDVLYKKVQIFVYPDSCIILVRRFLAILGVAGLLKTVRFWVSKL